MNDDERRQLLGVLGGVAIRHPLVHVDDIEFIECDACLVKPGSPRLCTPCQVNRAAIELLKSRVRLLEAMNPTLAPNRCAMLGMFSDTPPWTCILEHGHAGACQFVLRAGPREGMRKRGEP